MIVVLDHPLLILRREQRQNRGNLHGSTPDPLLLVDGVGRGGNQPSQSETVALVYTVGPPFAFAAAISASYCSFAVLYGRGLRIFSRDSSRLQSPQKVVVGGLGPTRRCVNRSIRFRGVLHRQYRWIHRRGLVLVEVLGREQIHRQRLDSRWRSRVVGRQIALPAAASPPSASTLLCFCRRRSGLALPLASAALLPVAGSKRHQQHTDCDETWEESDSHCFGL